jgi:hypothetical protein
MTKSSGGHTNANTEVRTSVQAIFEVRTSILAFWLVLLEKSRWYR